MGAKTIAVLTSGGDAPGMNAAVRAVVRSGLSFGMKVYGVMRGYNGLLNGDLKEMNMRSVSDIMQHGGTALFTARSPEFNTPEGVQKAANMCREKGIDGVVVIGGDGSFRGARDLTGAGIPCIGVPGTIDNDIACTDYTIGYDTALNTAMEMIDRIRDTTESHDRCSVVEVMGRRCGDIALNTGVAVGALTTLVPEIPYDFQKDVLDRIRLAQSTGKRHYIIVVAEGVGHTQELAERIQKETGIESRATILGHVQRGGAPTLRDRVVASRMGYHAVELLQNGLGNRVVAMKGEQIVDFDIIEKSNLGRQFLYKEEDVGALKTQIAHQEVSKMNSDIEVETHNLRITCVNDLLPLLDNVDIVICVIDEPQYDIQRIVNKAVVTKNIPCVFGASQVSRGRVYSVVPHQTGCFDCLNIHYTKIDSLFLEQFRGIRTVTKKIPTIAYGPAMFQLTSAIVDEAVRLITKYAEPMSLNRQYEINYENGASFTHKPWGHYPDECPTCGNGKEENWEIFSQYGEIKL